jgi:ERCC4-type nuclease
VAVIQTDSIDSTASLCRILLEQFQKDPTTFLSQDGAQKEYSHTVTVSKRANREDPKAFVGLVLQQCPGVSAPIASALVIAFGNLEGIMKTPETELAATMVTEKRRVGPAVAKRLYNLLHS